MLGVQYCTDEHLREREPRVEALQATLADESRFAWRARQMGGGGGDASTDRKSN